MDVDNDNATRIKRSPKPRCAKCGQFLSKNQFNKCIWCGEAVPEEFELTDDEKSAILSEQQKRKADLIAKDSKRLAEQKDFSMF